MEINIIIFINLLLYSIIVSQSFSYIISLENVQRNLSAGAYIEFRKLTDKNFRKRYPVILYLTLISTTLLSILTSMQPKNLLFISSVIAWILLIVDILITLKGSMPINNKINSWSTENYPADWEMCRTKWLTLFHKRQIANIIGFLSLLAGAVFDN